MSQPRQSQPFLGKERAEAHMGLLIAQAPWDPFSLSCFHVRFHRSFVSGSHELFLPSALSPFVVGQLGGGGDCLMACLWVIESGRAVRVGRAFLSLHVVLQRKNSTESWE